jgi:hypothetical protein
MSDQPAAPTRSQKPFTRVPLKECSIFVPASPLDVIPPTWSHFIKTKNLGGPRHAERLQQRLDKMNSINTSDQASYPAAEDRVLACSTPSDNDDKSIITVMITGFAEGADVGIWVMSNFEGRASNAPFTGTGEVKDGTVLPEDATLDLLSECHKSASAKICLSRDLNVITHLIGTLVIKGKDIDAAIDSMPESISDYVGNFIESDFEDIIDAHQKEMHMKMIRSMGKRERIRYEILKSILDSIVDYVNSVGPVVVPSLEFAHIGFVISTQEVCPATRTKSKTESMALASFQVFAGKHIMRTASIMGDANVLRGTANGAEVLASSCDTISSFIRSKSEELVDRIKNSSAGKPETPEDTALALYLGSTSNRYLGTRYSENPPPPEWCEFVSFVGWGKLAMILGATGEAFDSWNVTISAGKNMEVLSDDLTNIVFAGITEEAARGKSVEAEALGPDANKEELRLGADGDIQIQKKESLKQAKKVQDLMIKYLYSFDQSGLLRDLKDESSALGYAKKAFDEIVAKTNDFDKAPSKESEASAKEMVQDLLNKIAISSLKCKTLDEFLIQIRPLISKSAGSSL